MFCPVQRPFVHNLSSQHRNSRDPLGTTTIRRCILIKAAVPPPHEVPPYLTSRGLARAVPCGTPLAGWEPDRPTDPSSPLVPPVLASQAQYSPARTSDTIQHQPTLTSVWLTLVPSGRSTSAR